MSENNADPLPTSDATPTLEEQTRIQAFLLLYLMSEATEVSHAASKVVFFGPNDDYDGAHSYTALDALRAEVNDLRAVLEMLEEHGLACPVDKEQVAAKKQKVCEMYQYAVHRSMIPLPFFVNGKLIQNSLVPPTT